MRTKFQEDVANDLLVQLGHGARSIAELASKTGHNYYTVRLVVQTLIDEGQIIRADNRFRNAKLKLVDASTPTAVIPTVELNGNFYKLTDILGLRFQPQSKANTAVSNLPMHVTRLLNSARQEAEGKPQERTLRFIKTEMQRDREYLKSALDVYDQVLNNPINWNPNSLARFTTDPAFNPRDLQDSYNHYFEAKEETDE